ncbi:MAG: hypothetical protein KC503_42535 [Myxococcales bacterium]|nr:hypothetical protein [Myxococcales bacterium]
MFYGASIWMIVLGILGAANLIIARKPEAKELIGKLAPYQGWMGAVSALWGTWVVIHALMHMGFFLKWSVLGFIIYVANGGLLLCLGLLLGIGVLKSFVKHPTAQEKMTMMVAKLAPLQGTLGIVAICLGGFGVVGRIIIF